MKYRSELFNSLSQSIKKSNSIIILLSNFFDSIISELLNKLCLEVFYIGDNFYGFKAISIRVLQKD